MNDCPQKRFRGWDLLPLICEGEGECTGEMAAGQFSIFGAIEEIRRAALLRFLLHEERALRTIADARDRDSSGSEAAPCPDSGKGRLPVVHRACTGNAESRFRYFGKFRLRDQSVHAKPAQGAENQAAGFCCATLSGFDENQSNTRCSNSFGATLKAPQ